MNFVLELTVKFTRKLILNFSTGKFTSAWDDLLVAEIPPAAVVIFCSPVAEC